MPFTRPKAAQIDFDVTNISDPLIRLNSGQSGSNDKDIGLVIERGSDTNVALIWDESTDSFAVINTSEDGSTSGNVTISSYANLQAGTINATAYEIGSTGLVFEGSTADANETTLTVTDPTADRTITLPDLTGTVSLITATETLENKTLRAPTFESGGNAPEFLETRYVNATQMDFVQLYTGGSSGSYFTQGEYQKVATIIPDGDSQNYTFRLRMTATSASNYQIVEFTGALRSNTLPDLSFTSNYYEEHNGTRFIEPKLWTKETTTAGFILAFEYVHNANLYGGVNVEATIIPRSDAQRSNVTFNTTQNSEQTTIDTGYTENDPTLIYANVSGTLEFGTQFRIEGSTSDGNELTITATDPTADRTITFPDATGTVSLITATETLTNKTIDSANNTLTLDLSEGTLTGTTSEFNSALSDGSFATLAGTETLTNKTLTTPVISSISNTGTLTLPTSTDTLVGRATTDTLTNKTLTSPQINSPTFGGSIAITSTNTSTSPLTLTAASLNDGVGALRINSVEPDIFLNDTDGGFTTVTFANAGTSTAAIGRRSNDHFYITVNNGSWIDAFDINHDTANARFYQDLQVDGDTTVSGNLTVNGTTTTISTTNSRITDSLIELNNGAGSNTNDLGFIFERGSTGDNAAIIWDESTDAFVLGTTTATGDSTGNLTVTAGALSIGSLTLGGTALTSTATELNYLDGITGITLGSANEIAIVGTDGTSLTTTSVLTIDDSNNYIGINQTSPAVTLHMTGEGAQSAQIRMEQHNDSADAPDIRTRKSRGTAASSTKNNAGDYIFRGNFERYNGSAYTIVGQLAVDTNSSNADRFQLTLAVSEDGNSIDAANAQLKIDGNDSGAITFNGAYKFPTSDGTANQVLQTDGSGALSFATVSTSAIDNVVEDTTPQLGGMLDVNGNAIGDGTLELLKFSETASAVNEFTIANAATGNGPTLSATGGDTNIDINLTPKGTGEVVIGAGNLNYGGTAVTATGAELNYLDGVTGITLDNAGDLLIVGTDGTSIDSSALLNIDTGNGRLGIGTSSPARTLHLVGDTQFEGSMRIDQYHTSNDGPDILFQKARGTPSSTTAAANGDELIKIVGLVHDGTDFRTRVRILSDVVLDGSAYGANLQFQTGDNGDPTTRMTIDENGNVTFADGTTDVDIASHDGTNGLKLGGTLVTTSATELNLLDGVTGTLVTEAGTQTLTNKTLTSPQIGTDIRLNGRAELEFYDSDSSNYVSFRAPATVSSNVTWTLPATDGTDGQVLSTNGAGTFAWADAGGGGGSGSSFPNSTFTTCPASDGSDFDLSYNVAQTSQETPFEASGTDAFGVNLGSVFSLMDPIGQTDGPFDMGALT